MCIYIYIYRERYTYISLSLYIYIYICIHTYILSRSSTVDGTVVVSASQQWRPGVPCQGGYICSLPGSFEPGD